jgi:RNA binding exosome subunit
MNSKSMEDILGDLGKRITLLESEIEKLRKENDALKTNPPSTDAADPDDDHHTIDRPAKPFIQQAWEDYCRITLNPKIQKSDIVVLQFLGYYHHDTRHVTHKVTHKKIKEYTHLSRSQIWKSMKKLEEIGEIAPSTEYPGCYWIRYVNKG